jgi:uncharacterized protein (DUF433 family)
LRVQQRQRRTLEPQLIRAGASGVLNARATNPKLFREEGAMTEALIESNPEVMLGKPVIAGTRITVELVLEELAAGATIDDLRRAHPELSVESIRAALRYAAEAVRIEVSRPAKPAA